MLEKRDKAGILEGLRSGLVTGGIIYNHPREGETQ
jgi:hypothetical protein